MANGDERIPHPQGTVPGIQTPDPFQESKQRLDNARGDGSVEAFWSKVLATPPTKGEVAEYYPLSAIDTTGRYDYYAPYRDTEESYARGQSTWDKIGNGLIKMGGLAATTFVQGTVGAVYGLGDWIDTGEFSKLYDNEFNRELDAWNKKMENDFPHYYTHKEQDGDWYEPSSWFTGNFLWDKIVKNLGFAVGAAASGFAYGSALKALGITGSLVKAGKGLETLAALQSTLPKAAKAGRLEAMAQTLDDLVLQYGIKPAGQLLQKSDRILTAAMATSGEASIEALHNLNEFRNKAIEEYKNQFGILPSGEALNRINEQAENVGNWTYGLNTALLTGTNYIQFPKILGSSYRAEKSIANNIATQPLIRDPKTGLFKSALPQAGVKKLLNKAKNVAGLFFAPVEGFEEGAQYAIQRGTENYFNKKLQGEKVNWLEDALGYGVSETLNTREGMENILIGGISGGIMTSGFMSKIPGAKKIGFQGVGKIGERGIFGYGGQQAKATAEALSALNKSSFKKYIQDYANASKRAQISQERRAQFIRQGDILEAKEEEFDFTHDYLLPRIKYGRFEAVRQDINMYRQLSASPEGMAQMKADGIATADDTQQTFLARLAAFEEHANNANSLYSNLNLKYAGIVNEKGERKYSDDIIDRLVYAASKIKDYTNRMSQLGPILSQTGVSSFAIIDSINQGKSVPVAEVQEALDTINNNTSLTKDQKDDAKLVLQDTIEIGLRRKQFFKEYDKIVSTPENYKPEYVTEEELLSPKVKYRDREIEVGKEYSLEKPITREGNRLILSPKITLLSKTLEGEYEVKLPSGRHAFLTPKELETLKISETNNDSPEIEQALKTAIKEVLDKKEYEIQKANLPQADWINYINALDDVNLTNEIVAKISEVVKRVQDQKQKENEELAKIEKQKKIQEKLFKAQGELKPVPDTQTPTGEQLRKEAEGKKKHGKILFASTTSASEDEVPDTQANPRLLRERNFMYNQTFFKDRGEYKVILVTQNQEEKLGLKGLVESVAADDKERDYTNTDVDKGPVLAIYTKSEKGILYYVDENGKKLGKVGDVEPLTKVDINELVISTMSNTSTTWRDGKTSRFRAEDQANADVFAAQWRKQREQLFNNDTYSIFDFGVSRGIPAYDSYEEEGEEKYRENTIVGSLFPASEKTNVLNTQGVIVVTVTDSISHGGISYPTQQGRVYFKYGDRFAPLTNRRFTEKEQEVLYKSFLEMAKQAFDNKGIKGRYLNFVRGVLNFGRPIDETGKPKPAGRNQVWIDKQFYLNFGNNGSKMPFTPSALENNAELFKAFLSGTYNNINNALLRDEFETPFEEITIDDKGNLSSKQWKNYQHFLLDHENPFLKTPIRKLSPAVPNDRNFKQKYAILHGVEYVAKEPAKVPPKKEATPLEEKEPAPVIRVEVGDDGYIDGRILENGKVEIVSVVYQGKEVPPNPEKQAAREAIFLNGIKQKDQKKEEPKLQPPPAEPKTKPSKKKPRIKGKDKEYRIARTFSVDRMGEDEKQEFRKFMKQNLPQFTVEEVDQLIKATGDRLAWGRMMGDVIEYYRNAEKGTGYHEAFEGIWKYFLSPADKAAITNELAQRQGTFKDRETSQETEYSEASEKQLKEKLADEFAEYKIGKHVSSISEKIKSFFNHIIKFFRSFLRGYKINKPLVDQLFEKIETGAFRKFAIPKVPLEPEYRAIEGLSAAETHAFVQDMAARFMMELFREGADMFEIENYSRSDIFDIIKEEYEDDGTIAELPNGEKTYNELVTKTKEKLAPLSINFDENGVSSINDEGQTRIEYDSSSQKMIVDVRKTQPFGVKFLLASLYKTTGELKPDGTPIASRGIEGNYELLPPSRTTITLLETALGSTSLDDMVEKLRGLAAENSDYIRVLSRLGGKMNAGGQIDFDNLTKEQWRMLSGFYDSFNKQKPFVKEFRSENEGSYFTDMHIGTAAKQQFYSWENNIRRRARNGEVIFLPYDQKEKLYKVDKQKLDVYRNAVASKSKSTSEEQLKFLNDIGINFSKEIYDKLDGTQRDSFTNATNKILTYLGDKGGLKIIKSDLIGINGPLSVLSELYARIVKPDAESTFLNGEGKQQQVFIQPNYTSQFENVFNSIGNIQELKEALPWLADVYSTNSEILKLGGTYFNENGDRTGTKLLNGYVNATVIDGRPKLLKDADYAERLSVQINSILSDIFYISVPADASTEYALNLKGYITYKELLNAELSNQKIYTTFKNYLTDEINLAKENRESSNIKGKGKQLRFFKDILSSKNKETVERLIEQDEDTEDILLGLTDEVLNADFAKYIEKKVSEFTRALRSAGLVEEQTDGSYAFPTLLSSYAENFDKNKMSEEEYNRVSKHVWLNNFIAQTELHKVLFGDPYNFAIKGKVMDETKRIKSFLSPAQPTLVSEHYNNTFNKIYNEVGGVRLEGGILGEYDVMDTVHSITIKEVEVIGQIINERLEYQGIKEGDAEAWHTILMHRDLKNRHFKWGKKEEDWLQFEEAYRRLRMNKKGQLKDFQYPPALKEHDTKLIGWNGETNTKRRPEIFFNVEKPIVRGVNQNYDSIRPILDKFSSAPIWYSAVEGTALEDVYIAMISKQIDYIIMESGRKVGADNYHNLYNEDGTLNSEFSYDQVARVNWSDYYIQQENVYDPHKSQTRGTQITKLFSLDFFSGGEPIDGDPEIAEKAKQNDRLLEELTKHGYETTLKKLGLTDNGTYFTLNRKKFMETLANESFKRDMPDNIRDIFKPDPFTGQYNIPFEATSEYTKIQKILYSIADREIITQHYNGGNKTQMSVTGWENKEKGRDLVIKEEKDGKFSYRKIDRVEYALLTDEQKKNVHLTSSRLKFYSKDDRYMEVMLPNWFRAELRQRGIKKTDAELLTFLNTTEEGKKILEGIGFRIPTQAMSQIETIRVAGFLAPEYGDTIVVPSEITTKAGSDFDIDKLNTYLKNIYIDVKGNIKLVPFFGFGEEARVKFENLFLELTEEKKQEKKEKIEKTFTLQQRLGGILEEKGTEENQAKWKRILKEMFGEQATAIDIENELMETLQKLGKDVQNLESWDFLEAAQSKFVDKFYKKSLENEYITNLEWFISHPKNYERLLTPTEGGDLKAIAEEISKMTEGEETDDLTKLLDISYQSSLRHAFMSAKRWIGIMVNGITSHAQAQRTNIYLDVKNTILSVKDKEVLRDGNILLNHNKDSEGRPTLSVIKNSSGKHISDILSWFCTAIVDVAKDPYITKIIHNKKLVPTFTFLTRAGVPTNELIYFMNQPIIREYMRYSDEMGFSKVANDYWRTQFKSLNKFPAKETATALDRKSFKDVIQKYYDGTPLTVEENTHQNLVLDEFLKYFKMSEHLFSFTQATNWDTSDFKTGGAIYKKQVVEQRENKRNIFKSPETLLDNTFLRKMAEAMGFTRQAMGALSRFENEQVRNELDQVLKPYVLLTSYQAPDTLEKIDSVITSSFIDYLIQTKAGLNNRINDILIDESTSVAKKIDIIQNDPEKLDNYNNNPIFSYLRAQTSNFDKGADNVILRPFPKQTYDKDLLTNGLRELRELEEGKKDSLYSGVIRLALLQGTGNAANLSSYIPSEDFSKAVMPLIEGNLKEAAEAFAKNWNFQRNKWNDEDIVPEFKPIILPPNRFREYYKYDINFPFNDWKEKVIRLSDTFNSREIEYPVIKVQKAPLIKYSANRFDLTTRKSLGRDASIKEMISRGDYSFMHFIGYQKVFLPNGEPLTKTLQDKGKWITYQYYKQVNLTGDRNVQEHYIDQRHSILDNQTVKIDQAAIVPDQAIIDRVNGKSGGDKGIQTVPAPAPKPITPAPTAVAPSLKKIEVQMQPDNVERILSGTKTTTIRSAAQSKKINLAAGESGEVTFKGRRFKVTNRGNLAIEQAGGKEAMIKSEGLTSEDQFKYKQSKDWVNGKGKLYVYDIAEIPQAAPVEKGTDLKKKAGFKEGPCKSS